MNNIIPSVLRGRDSCRITTRRPVHIPRCRNTVELRRSDLVEPHLPVLAGIEMKTPPLSVIVSKLAYPRPQPRLSSRLHHCSLPRHRNAESTQQNCCELSKSHTEARTRNSRDSWCWCCSSPEKSVKQRHSVLAQQCPHKPATTGSHTAYKQPELMETMAIANKWIDKTEAYAHSVK
jgi:hypothetical protein